MMIKTSAFAAMMIVLAACGAPTDTASDPVETIREASEATIITPVETALPDPQLSSEIDPVVKRGKIVYLQCRSCHTLKQGEPHLTGPNLHQVFGRMVGKIEGFGFSDVMLEADFVWTAETLDAWLEQPNTFLKGNAMAYAGLRRASDRDALIAYLKQETR